MFKNTNEYKQGYNSFEIGDGLIRCPYSKNESTKRKSWVDGWNEAKKNSK